MSANFFGQNRDLNATKVFASPEYAILTVAGGDSASALVQSIQGEYGRRVDSLMIVGDPNVYWGFGNSEGTLSIGRFVGCGAFFKGWQGSKCGLIETISIDAGDGDDCVCGAGGLVFSEAAITSVAFRITAGDTTMGETINMKVADMVAGA